MYIKYDSIMRAKELTDIPSLILLEFPLQSKLKLFSPLSIVVYTVYWDNIEPSAFKVFHITNIEQI